MKINQDKNVDAFFSLLKAGLWEKDVHLSQYERIDFNEVNRLAEEQSVIGLIAAGVQHVVDVKVPQIEFLTFIGRAVQLEQQNSAMNKFIESLVKKMRKAGVYTLLVKGQGIAQCYERPLWRSCGDVDLFLSDDNYKKAKAFLIPKATKVDAEGAYNNHQGMTIDSWIVELHGSLRCGLSSRMDRNLDKIKNEVFHGGNVRSWMNGKTQVFLPGVDCDILFVFTHFIKHFYLEGLGLRQICDWCRLLWTYRDKINVGLLEQRLRTMGLITEWKAFGAFAVDYLGMPSESMPLYSSNPKWKRKADRICSFVLEVGNMGHNRDSSYFVKYPYLIRKACSLRRRCGDLIHHARIFPMDSIRFLPSIVFHGFRNAARGE